MGKDGWWACLGVLNGGRYVLACVCVCSYYGVWAVSLPATHAVYKRSSMAYSATFFWFHLVLLRCDTPLRTIRNHLFKLFLHLFPALHVLYDIIQRNDRDDGHVEFLFDFLDGGSGALLSPFLSIHELDYSDELCFRVGFEDGDGFPDCFL